MSAAWYERPGRRVVHGVPEGYDALVLSRAASALAGAQRPILHVARDDARLARLSEAVAFFAPEIDLLISLSCNQAKMDGDRWPHRVNGFTIETRDRLSRIYEKLFGPVPPGA